MTGAFQSTHFRIQEGGSPERDGRMEGGGQKSLHLILDTTLSILALLHWKNHTLASYASGQKLFLEESIVNN